MDLDELPTPMSTRKGIEKDFIVKNVEIIFLGFILMFNVMALFANYVKTCCK